MKIGVDIDGVLINSQAMWKERGLLFNKYNNLKTKTDMSKFLPGAMFGWTEEEDFKFWKEFFEDYYRFSLPVAHAVNTIKKLKEEGHEIIIITGRATDPMEEKLTSKENLFQITETWLKTNEIPYDEIFFSYGSSKTKICFDKQIDIMIEDNVDEVKNISNIIPVICVKRPYNEEIKTFQSNYKVYRTEDWNMIYTIIEYRLNR